MQNISYKQGLTTGIIIVIVIAILAVAGGVTYIGTTPDEEGVMEENAMMEEDMMKDDEKMEQEEVMSKDKSDEESGKDMMAENEDETMMKNDVMMKEGNMISVDEAGEMMEQITLLFTGSLLAGSKATPLLDFTKSDYDKALSAGKPIVMYFYANWCPICKKEFPEMQNAFDNLDADIVGFRVNYNDSDTDNYEKELAREFGVAYQHTKVFLNSKGERILKAPESWDEAKYTEELNNLAGK